MREGEGVKVDLLLQRRFHPLECLCRVVCVDDDPALILNRVLYDSFRTLVKVDRSLKSVIFCFEKSQLFLLFHHFGKEGNEAGIVIEYVRILFDTFQDLYSLLPIDRRFHHRHNMQ